jgi:alpha,alpha-trehalase
MDRWTLSWDDYRPAAERLRETLCTLGNGYFSTRGAWPDSPAEACHYPGTYIAGGYDRAVTRVAGRDLENEDLVNFPNWICLTFRVDDGPWFRLDETEVLDYRQQLRMREGVLARECRVRLPDGGPIMRWSERRLVSMDDPHLAGLCVELTPEERGGRLAVRSSLDGSVVNAGVERYRELEGRHFEVLHAADDEPARQLVMVSRTLQSRIEVAQAARTRVFRGGEEVSSRRDVQQRNLWIGETLTCNAVRGVPLRIEKILALHTSTDTAITEPRQASTDAARRAPRFGELRASHRRAWEELWAEFELGLELTDEQDGSETQCKLRAHTYHLLQTVSPHSIDLDIGVPARGWHGEAYRGHVFWDELFIFPLLGLRMPMLARSLLLYRYRRLPSARRAAAAAGYRGAMFPWQSGSDGREESQSFHLNPESGRWIPDETFRQRHIGAAIAYNVWHYYEVTEDHEFLCEYGAEMIIEIARFFACRASFNEDLGRYEMLRIVGPDEYHTRYPGTESEAGLDNNAYTNVMAVWTMMRAIDAFNLLDPDRRARLRRRIGLSDEEIEQWFEITRKMRICFHDDDVISQFEGYEELDEFDWEGYREEYDDIRRLDRILEAEGESPNRFKVSKQADVLMLFYLLSAAELKLIFDQLGYRLGPETITRNIAYYLERTSHGSTLSGVTHAWVLARADRYASWRLFQEALDSDLHDLQCGTTPEGIHTGAMAGTVDLVHRCYSGLETRGGILRFNPVLPSEIRQLSMRLKYRRHRLHVEINRQRLSISSWPLTALPIRVAYRGHHRRLAPGESCSFRLLAREKD